MAWNQNSRPIKIVVDGKEQKKAVRFGRATIGLAALAVAVVLLLVIVLLPENRQTQVETVIPPTRKKVEPDSAPVPSDLKEVAHTNVQTAVAEGPKVEQVLIEARTNSNSGVIIERYRTPDGKTHRKVINPPPIFTNPSDQIIALAISARAGQRIPPLPPMRPDQLNQAFVNSLSSPIEIKDDDKPEVAALKLAVSQTRSEIAELIKAGDGRTVAEILQEHVETTNRNADMRAEAASQLRRILESQDPEMAEEYLSRANKLLQEYGINPLKMPSNSSVRSQQ